MTYSEVPVDRLEDHASLFPGRQLALLRQSVAAGNTWARLWVGSAGKPATSAILWDFGNKGLYLGGDYASGVAGDALGRFLRQELAAVAQADGLSRYSIRAVSSTAAVALRHALGDNAAVIRKKLFHEHPVTSGTPDGTLPPDLEFAGIDQRLLSAGLVNVESVAAEVQWMWPSVDRFIAEGWGVAAVARGALVCWCTSEYVGASQCGIGIETVSAYQNRGIATATAARFVDEALRRGKSPCWECAEENQASLRVAQKLGFTLTESTIWYHGRWE